MNPENLTPVLIALISAGSALVATLLTAYGASRRWMTEKRIPEANAAQKLGQMAIGLADDWRQQVESLRERVRELEQCNREYKADLDRFRQDLIRETERIRKLERENENLRNLNAALNAELNRLRERLDEIDDAADAAQD